MDMLCFSHDFRGDPLSKTHLMRLLAQRGHRVLWVNSIGYRTPSLKAKRDLGRAVQKLKAAARPIEEIEKNLYVISPLIIPAWGKPLIQKLNAQLLRWQVRRAMKRLRFQNPINWIFNPAAGILAGTLNESKLIYYCVDEYTAFSGVNADALTAIEKELLSKADLVVVSAEKLLASKKSPNAPTVLVRHGVDYEHFRKALDPATIVPAEIANLPRPIIGYFGLIAEDWIDLPLLEKVAAGFPQGTIVMIGKVTTNVEALLQYGNIRFLGRQPYEALPSYCKGFDVAMIPFPISDVTLNANPLKAREYLAAGLPVVSTAIPEVEVLGECLVGRTHDEFVEKIREALKEPGANAARSLRMAGQSWAARLDEVMGRLPKDT